MPVSRMAILDSAPYANASKMLRLWINKWRGTQTKEYREYELAELAGINPTLWSKIRSGRDRPTPEHCLSIAYWLEMPVDVLLREWGYPDVRALRDIVSKDTQHGKAERRFIVDMLDAALSEQWQHLDPSRNFQKNSADFFQTRPERELENFTKAKHYAMQVYNWLTDPQRSVMMGSRKTDEIVKILAES